MSEPLSRAYYVTAPDRVGLALLAGGVVGGLAATALGVAGGQRSPLALGVTLLVGTIVAIVGMVALAGPVWLVVHHANRRGPGAAATTAASLTLTVFTIGQVVGTGGGAYRWASAIATGAIVALAAAALAIVMHQIAYRRLM